ncbi:hypothetical protein C9374_002354 [Naegleria lovaniensis]|uniref:Polycystin cation channel PKD1/PKD2 domain-containing protein n=1 Tax=Naegleria lovaniensis TaxID=51637 RepID=A0AA88GTI6_NAELO|nr:uncharacterized protein C9374_002354 [Naegleria lovaniensis]KAG2386610.1 hypothetical protein C9374_002354 [Naegleria lovaniensis]
MSTNNNSLQVSLLHDSDDESANLNNNNRHSINSIQDDNLPSNTRVIVETPTFFTRSYRFLKQTVLPQDIGEDDAIQLSLIQKFLKYRVFPTKMIIDILQVILVMLFVAFYVSEFKNYKTDISTSFANFFMPAGFEGIKENDDGFYTSYIYNVDDLQKSIQSIVLKYYSIQDNSVSVVIPTGQDIVKLHVQMLKENPRQLLSNETVYDSDPSIVDWRFIARSDISSVLFSDSVSVYENLTQDDPLGTLFNVTGDELKYVVDRIQYIELFFKIITLDTSLPGYPSCYKWTVQFFYKFIGGGRVDLQLNRNYENCVANDSDFYTSIFKRPRGYVGLFLCLVSALSLGFYSKSLITRVRVFYKRRKTNKMLRFATLLSEYLGFSLFVAFLKDTLLILGFLAMIIKTVTNETMDVFSQTCLGVGSFCSLINLTKYFNYQAKFYLVARAFTKSIPTVLRYVGSISPIFAGFVCCGVMWFGFYSNYFKDVDGTMVTLYSAMHGDNLRIVFEKIFAFSLFHKVLGRMYTLIFLLLFICAIVNIFLSIVQESYSNVLMKITEAGGENEAVTIIKQKEAKLDNLTSQTYLNLKNMSDKSEKGQSGDDDDDDEADNDSNLLPVNLLFSPRPATSTVSSDDKGETLFINSLKKAIYVKLEHEYLGHIPTKQLDNLKDLINQSNVLISKFAK